MVAELTLENWLLKKACSGLGATKNEMSATLRTLVALDAALEMAPTYLTTRTKRADLAATRADVLERAMGVDILSASSTSWTGNPLSSDWADEARL